MATARKLPSGSWRVRVYIGCKPDGSPIYKSITGDSKKDAERKAATFSYSPASSSPLTLRDAVYSYISIKENILSPSTLTGYLTMYRNYLGHLGDFPLSRLSNDKIQQHFNLLAVDHSPKTLTNFRSLLISVLKLYAPSFVLIVKVPAKKKVAPYIPSDDDVRALIDAAHDTPIELPIILAAFGSLRRSEISGLFPDCVFSDHISIRRVYVQAPDRSWILKDQPKSFAGYRDVYLHPYIMEAIHALCDDVPSGHSVFDLRPDQIYTRFETARKKAGVTPFKFHALRHYFATFSHAMGIPDQYIAKIGGWEDVSTLQRIYQHTAQATLDVASQSLISHFEDVALK